VVKEVRFWANEDIAMMSTVELLLSNLGSKAPIYSSSSSDRISPEMQSKIAVDDPILMWRDISGTRVLTRRI
jgi:hypothetical protein